MNKYVGLYGNVKLLRKYCWYCKQMAIVVDNIIQCCDRQMDESGVSFYNSKRMSGTSYERKRPSVKRIKKLIIIQQNKCLYCDIPFGTHYKHPVKNKFMITTVCCDHYIPFCYAQDNHDENFVLACGVCNGIKSGKIFKNLEDAQHYVRDRRKKKGYTEEIYVK